MLGGAPYGILATRGVNRGWEILSLRFRLIGLVYLALVVSLALGGATAWVNAARSVRTEMRSALLVGRQTIESEIERLQQAADPSRGLDDLVTSFKGNRHLRVQFAGQAQAVATPIVETPPFGALPNWFIRVLRVAPVIDRVPIIVGGRDYGTITLETDPHNEILEVWNEFTDGLVTPAVFSSLTILLIYLFIGRALRRLLAEGRRLSQIADTVGIGYKTAANNCSRIKARLGAASTADLIRIAIRAGLVEAGLLEPSSQNIGRPI
jgi:two-component system sensor histidine kinase UhpB